MKQIKSVKFYFNIYNIVKLYAADNCIQLIIQYNSLAGFLQPIFFPFLPLLFYCHTLVSHNATNATRANNYLCRTSSHVHTRTYVRIENNLQRYGNSVVSNVSLV